MGLCVAYASQNRPGWMDEGVSTRVGMETGWKGEGTGFNGHVLDASLTRFLGFRHHPARHVMDWSGMGTAGSGGQVAKSLGFLPPPPTPEVGTSG